MSYKTLTVSKNITLSSGDGYNDLTVSFPIDEIKSITEYRGVRGGFHGADIVLSERKPVQLGRKRGQMLEELMHYLKKNKIKFEHKVISDCPNPGY